VKVIKVQTRPDQADRKKILTVSYPSCKSCAGLIGLQRLRREIYIWSRLSHDNILPILGLYIDSSKESHELPALVSPWCEKGNLTEYLRAAEQAGSPRSEPILGILGSLDLVRNLK
jgi:serine/threonine protein kinase